MYSATYIAKVIASTNQISVADQLVVWAQIKLKIRNYTEEHIMEKLQRLNFLHSRECMHI